MADLVTNPKDPRLGRGEDKEQVPQNAAYLVLSDEERAKGFVRPVRTSYVHVGIAAPKYPLLDLTEDQHMRYDQYGYVKFEEYPHDDAVAGKFWTQKELDAIGKGCGTATKMSLPIAETYARDPKFYGSTYCCTCQRHIHVSEFVWEGTSERVGS